MPACKNLSVTLSHSFDSYHQPHLLSVIIDSNLYTSIECQLPWLPPLTDTQDCIRTLQYHCMLLTFIISMSTLKLYNTRKMMCTLLWLPTSLNRL